MNRDASIHVVHVVPGLPVGGAEVDLAVKCRVLREAHGTESTIICLRRRGVLVPALEAEGFRVLGPLIRGRHDVAGLTRYRRLLIDLEPGLVHTHLLPATLATLAVFRTASMSRTSWIISEHSAPHRWGRLSLSLCRRAVARADRFCLPTAATLTAYRESGFDMRAASVVPNALDVDRIDAGGGENARTDVRRELGVSEDATLVGTVCRLVAVKNLTVLIEAIRDLDATLIIVGDGPEKPRLESLITTFDLADRVRLIGERHDVPRLLAAFDVFALASGVETFGIAVAEALIAGLPVVATRVGGIPEIVGPDMRERLVEPGDVDQLRAAIERVLGDVEGARAIAREAGAGIRARYAPRPVVEQLQRLYERVLAESRTS